MIYSITLTRNAGLVNALNALYAVHKWKKMWPVGKKGVFYQDIFRITHLRGVIAKKRDNCAHVHSKTVTLFLVAAQRPLK